MSNGWKESNQPGGQTGNPRLTVASVINSLKQARSELKNVDHALWGHRDPALDAIARATERLQKALAQFQTKPK